MAHIQPEVKQQSLPHRETVRNQKAVLKGLRDVVASCRGPHGRSKMLQNQTGGNLTITSASRRLYTGMSVRKPIIQLVITAAQGHLNAFNDGGLFVVYFASDLVLETLDSVFTLKILSELFERFLTYSISYLREGNCSYKMKVSLSDIHFMCTYIRNIICTKPVCCLSNEHLQVLSQVLLESFLHSLTSAAVRHKTHENVFYLCNEGFNVTETKTVTGLLIQAPEISKFQEIDLKPIKIYKNGMHGVRVVLITVSLSGDMDELNDVRYLAEDGVDVDSAVIDILMKFCDHLIDAGIGLVLCQKVVHPQLKYRLRQAGVVLVDRLGMQPVSYVQKLTGASGLQTFNIPVSDHMYGWVDNVRHSVVHGKSFLHLTKEDNCVCTLVLCHRQEQALQELKDVCTVALASLDHLVECPYVLTGAGCWQTGLATYLTHKVSDEKFQLSEEHDCSASTVVEACHLFTRSLQTAGLSQHSKYVVNNSNGHLYHRSTARVVDNSETQEPASDLCCCKLGEAAVDDFYSATPCHSKLDRQLESIREVEPVNLWDKFKANGGILDSFSMCVNALQTAVLTACSVLRIKQVIENCS